MKIEKINENQIRCTLTKSDLEERHIRLSELAYGSDKAKDLFRDMMQQANTEFGFEADNIPLMIEAIPVSADRSDPRFGRQHYLNNLQSGGPGRTGYQIF